MKNRLEFDMLNFSFSKVTRKAWHIVVNVLVFLMGTFSLSVLVYVFIAMFFSTDAERRLSRENRMYEKVWSSLIPRAERVEETIAGLQHKDDEIYGLVFHSSAPSLDPMASMDAVYANDSIPDTKLRSYVRDKSDQLVDRAAEIEETFRKTIALLSEGTVPVPPMSLPVEKLSYVQVGASSGSRMNPFYNAMVFHSGLDILVSRGTPVLATADGVVEYAKNARSGQGNTVKINHEGGYQTVYAHMDNISVKSGQKVTRGQKIGTVGMSGSAYAPHLHYEVRKDDVPLDPVNCFFASVTPDDYATMLYMSANTLQSMD